MLCLNGLDNKLYKLHRMYIKNEVFEVCYHIQKSSKPLVVVNIVFI